MTAEHSCLNSEELSVDSILDADGLISRRLPDYESRPQQLAMAREVAKALASDQHLVAEAGTGTGKSFAYLAPAILHATSDRVTPAGDSWESSVKKRCAARHGPIV